jgi:hypothetical protein
MNQWLKKLAYGRSAQNQSKKSRAFSKNNKILGCRALLGSVKKSVDEVIRIPNSFRFQMANINSL